VTPGPLECAAIVAEAEILATARVVAKCRAWRVPARSVAAAVLEELGLPAGDAQVVRYGEGGGYAWHTDGAARAETVVIQLTDPAQYDGGDVEVRLHAGERLTAGREQGALTRFPANATHRTAPVTRGERWALVAWTPA